VALLALVNHLGKFDFQVLLSFDRLHARTTSTKSRRFIQVAANDSFRVATIRPGISPEALECGGKSICWCS
jgi:hypothetical protein